MQPARFPSKPIEQPQPIVEEQSNADKPKKIKKPPKTGSQLHRKVVSIKAATLKNKYSEVVFKKGQIKLKKEENTSGEFSRERPVNKL